MPPPPPPPPLCLIYERKYILSDMQDNMKQAYQSPFDLLGVMIHTCIM